MVEFLVGIFIVVVIGVVLDKTTEDRFHDIKPHLREIWWVIGFLYVAYWILRPESEQYFMALKKGFGVMYPVASYALAAILGAALFTGYWLLLGIILPTTMKGAETDQDKEPPKPPPIEQHSTGNKSPNTVIIGNDNTVINNADPSISQKLDKLLKLAEKQGSSIEPDKLLAKYPLGYVIFDIDKRNEVFPYATQSLLENWDFDWSAVKIREVRFDNQDEVVITMPTINPKSGHGEHFNGVGIQVPKRVGPIGVIIWRSATFDMKAEILSIRPDGIVFLLGFARHS